MAKGIFESENLYHFTKYDSAFKILLSQNLLFGKYSNMNDINEAMRIFCHSNLEDDSKEQQRIKDIEKYQQLSFTMDINQNIKGFELSSMWGHYAEKGFGVCLVFDKEILLDSIKNDSRYTRKKIKYTDDVSNWKSLDDANVIDEIFFKKFTDWKYENEYRIIVQSDSKKRESLNIRNSLKAIIMMRVKDTDHIEESTEYICISNLLAYLRFNIPIFELYSWINEKSLKCINNKEQYSKNPSWQEFKFSTYHAL